MTDKIKYRDAHEYKYQLADDYHIQTLIRPGKVINHPTKPVFITLDSSGIMTIHAGYAWNGASGPSIDTKNTMRGSLVHDALYAMMQAGLIEEHYCGYADKLLRDILREDGMSDFRSWYYYQAVRKFGASSAKAGSGKEERKIYIAP